MQQSYSDKKLQSYEDGSFAARNKDSYAWPTIINCRAFSNVFMSTINYYSFCKTYHSCPVWHISKTSSQLMSLYALSFK